MRKLIPYGKQTINISDINSVKKVFKSSYLTTGPNVNKFENLFKKKVNSKFAISCSNGTAALHLSFLAIGLKKNDNIILPAINFIAAANMARLLESRIFLADVDPLTGQVSTKTIEETVVRNKITSIKAIVVMHNAGAPNYSLELLKLKKKYKCFIIEDACHSLGGIYSKKNNIKVGSSRFSDISTFSFHPVKSITTAEGGMLTTNQKKLSDKIKLYRNHGMQRKVSNINNYYWNYKIIKVGFNFRLSDINCALGFSQLKRIDSFIKSRNRVASKYKKFLSEVKNFVHLPKKEKDRVNAWHLYIINFKLNKLTISRDKIIQLLYKKGIITQVHYIPTHKQPLFKDLNKSWLKGANQYYRSCLSLPIYPDLKNNQIKYITDCLKDIINRYNK